MLVRLQPNSPGVPFTVVQSGVATGYALLKSLDLGNASWQHALSGARGTQGARPATGEPDNRNFSIPIRIGPAGSVDLCNLRISLLCEAVDELRRFGGRICLQAPGQALRSYLDVMLAGITRESWSPQGSADDVATCTIAGQAGPYLLHDSMDTLDAFAVDSLADYTFDVANTGAGALSVAGGRLVPGATGLKRIRHTAKGFAYSDAQVALRVTTGATVAGGVWGVTARASVTGADTLLACEIVAGTNVIRLVRYDGSTRTDLASTAFTPVANTTYWIAIRTEGRFAQAFVYAGKPTDATPPAIGATVLAQTSATIPPARDVPGHAGARITAADTAERYGPFVVQPYTYAGVQMPQVQRLTGAIPGDAPALVDAYITPRGNNAPPIWGLAAWSERPQIANACWNGDFEDANIGTSGWSGAAVTGVLASGASTLSRITTASLVKYGAAALQIVTPATTDTGASFLIQRLFRRGRVYAALCWASSAAQTTAARIKLGVNGDLATGAAVALSTTPKLYSVTWQVGNGAPDWGSAYVAFGVNAATATTMAIDGMVVVESPLVALAAAQGSTTSTAFSAYSIPSDLPGLLPDGTLVTPFLAMIDQEIIRVTAVNPATGVITGDRGQEGTTAATHAQDALLVVLPPLRPHLEGKGAQPPFGFIEGEGYVPALSSVTGGSLAAATDANAKNGSVLRWTTGTSGAQVATLVWFVDPNLLVPDDYTLGEIDVEVWIREAWSNALANMRVTLSAQPEGGITLGPERTTREWQSGGKLIQPATAKVNRPHRLGCVPMIVDRSNPQRWRLKLTLACTGAVGPPLWDVDYLMLVASRARLYSPTGEINDTAAGASASYPGYVPYDPAWGGSSAMTKLMRSDGSAMVGAPGSNLYPDVGFGDVLEMPDGDCDFLVKCSGLVPDDPSTDADDEQVYYYLTDLHLAVTPRSALWRGS